MALSRPVLAASREGVEGRARYRQPAHARAVLRVFQEGQHELKAIRGETGFRMVAFALPLFEDVQGFGPKSMMLGLLSPVTLQILVPQVLGSNVPHQPGDVVFKGL